MTYQPGARESEQSEADRAECERLAAEFEFNGQTFLFDQEDMVRVKALKLTIDTKGYLRYRTSMTGIRKSFGVHRLLSAAKDYELVDHINGNIRDNRKANLRVCTSADNIRNRIHLNTKSKLPKWITSNHHGYKVSFTKDGKRVFSKTFQCLALAVIARDKYIRDNDWLGLKDHYTKLALSGPDVKALQAEAEKLAAAINKYRLECETVAPDALYKKFCREGLFKALAAWSEFKAKGGGG